MREQHERARNRVVVVERLAHPHEDHVANALAGLELATAKEHLRDNFSIGHLALQARNAGGAEHAAHCAADLTRDALGDDALVAELRDQHRLDLLAVRHADEELLGPISRLVCRHDVDRPAPALFLHALAESLGKIAHLVRVENALSMDPVEDLLSPIRRLAPGADLLFPFSGQARNGV